MPLTQKNKTGLLILYISHALNIQLNTVFYFSPAAK